MVECPNCETLNDEENQFCGECGTKLPEPKICPSCNYQSYENKYCTKCGTKLVSKEEYDKTSNKIESLLKQARNFLDNNELNEAIKCFDEILNISQGDAQIVFALNEKAKIYWDLGKYEEAIECYDKCILIDPEEYFFYFHKGEILLELNNFDKALYCFDKAFKIKNDDPFYCDMIVNNLIRFSKFEEAMDYCNRGLNHHPEDISLNFNKAILLGLNNEFLKANDLILKYNLNGARIFNTVAHKFNLMGEFHKAKRFCSKSIDFDSQYYSSWLTMGEIYFNLEKYEESLKYFKKGFELSLVDKDEIINGLIKECQEFVKSNI